jgi:hypothetical protein
VAPGAGSPSTGAQCSTAPAVGSGSLPLVYTVQAS